MGIVEAEIIPPQIPVGPYQAVGSKKTILKHVIEQAERGLSDRFVPHITAPTVQQMRPADGIRRPAWPFQVTKRMPVHGLAVQVHKARFGAQVRADWLQATERKARGVTRTGKEDLVDG